MSAVLMKTVDSVAEQENDSRLLNNGKEISLIISAAKTTKCKVYTRRWFILFIYVFYTVVNSMQWIQYSIIANIAMKFYNVSSASIDWTSMVFMVTYVVLIYPSSYMIEKKGLRNALVWGCVLLAVGSWIKVASAAPDRFLVTFAGHTVVGMAQVFMLPIPPRLSAVWFGSDQVSTACSIGVFGNQLGLAVGFLLPPMMVHNHDNMDDIGADLSVMFYWTAGLSTLILLMVLAFFKDEPPLPPSPAQKAERAIAKPTSPRDFLAAFKRMLTNRGYNLLLVSYGICIGVLNAVCTLLNQVILMYFENGEEFAGRVGLVLVVAGMLGSVVFGIILDKTHKYKEMTVLVYVITAVGMLLFAFSLHSGSQPLVYITSSALGCFMGGYMPVGFELAAEITYPEAEGTTAGLLLVPPSLLGIIFTVICSWLINVAGDIWANMALTALLVIGACLTTLIPSHLRRLAANSLTQQDEP